MAFLEKIGLKHKHNDSDIPPPPPAPKSTSKPEEPKQELKAPVEKPSPAEPPKPVPKIQDLPSRKPSVPSQEPKLPEFPEDKVPSREEIEEVLLKNRPEKAPSQAPKQESKSLSREELRKAFDDVPPIRTPQKPAQSQINDDAVKSFDVDEFVLPGEDTPEPEAPAPKKQASSVPELYISVDVYDDIQKRVLDLKKQVAGSANDIDAILAERDKEDQNFADFIQDLERIQEDLIKIDEDLFTQQ